MVSKSCSVLILNCCSTESTFVDIELADVPQKILCAKIVELIRGWNLLLDQIKKRRSRRIKLEFIVEEIIKFSNIPSQ